MVAFSSFRFLPDFGIWVAWGRYSQLSLTALLIPLPSLSFLVAQGLIYRTVSKWIRHF